MAFDGRLLAGVGVLAAVVESGSFTRAAASLALSASGVSRAVSRLEERLGVRLLDRTTRALRLTDEGKRFYTLAAPHLDAIADAASVAAKASTHVRGKLRASVNSIIAQALLGPRMAEFVERFPDLNVELLPPVEAGDLVSEGIDVAIRFGPQPSSALSTRLLLHTRVMTVAAPSYIAKRGRPKTPADLERHSCIQFPDPLTGSPFDWEFRRGQQVLPVATSGALLMTDVAAMVAACTAGAGIAQLLAISAQPLLASGQLIELFPDWPDETFPLYAVRPSRRLAPLKVATFIDFCEEICRPHDTRAIVKARSKKNIEIAPKVPRESFGIHGNRSCDPREGEAFLLISKLRCSLRTGVNCTGGADPTILRCNARFDAPDRQRDRDWSDLDFRDIAVHRNYRASAGINVGRLCGCTSGSVCDLMETLMPKKP